MKALLHIGCVTARRFGDLANKTWVEHIVSGEYRQYYDMMYRDR